MRHHSFVKCAILAIFFAKTNAQGSAGGAGIGGADVVVDRCFDKTETLQHDENVAQASQQLKEAFCSELQACLSRNATKCFVDTSTERTAIADACESADEEAIAFVSNVSWICTNESTKNQTLLTVNASYASCVSKGCTTKQINRWLWGDVINDVTETVNDRLQSAGVTCVSSATAIILLKSLAVLVCVVAILIYI